MTVLLLFLLVVGLWPILLDGILEGTTALLHVFETLLILLGLGVCLVVLAGLVWVMWEIRQPV